MVTVSLIVQRRRTTGQLFPKSPVSYFRNARSDCSEMRKQVSVPDRNGFVPVRTLRAEEAVVTMSG
jgi:hypothetical protein